jgi:hypothetical protein
MSGAQFDPKNPVTAYRIYFLMVTSWIMAKLDTDEDLADFLYRIISDVEGIRTSGQTPPERSSPESHESRKDA